MVKSLCPPHTHPTAMVRVNCTGQQTSSSVTGWHHPGSTQVFADRKLTVLPMHYSALAGQAFNHRPPSAQLEAKLKLRDSDDIKSQLLESPQHQYSRNISRQQHQIHLTQGERQKFHEDTKI